MALSQLALTQLALSQLALTQLALSQLALTQMSQEKVVPLNVLAFYSSLYRLLDLAQIGSF